MTVSVPNQPRQGNLEGPLLVVMEGPAELFVIQASEVKNSWADAQMFELDANAMLDQIKPLPQWLKFMYGVEEVTPPVPFTERLVALKVEAYKAAKAARQAADE